MVIYTSDRIIEYLKKHKKATVEEIQKELNIEDGDLQVTINLMLIKGIIEEG